jgi:hypothetical protein
MPLALAKEGTSPRKIIGLLALEAAVIFAGITSSFWMEELRQQRDDQKTYGRLLEEIYYNAVVDESQIPIGIAQNNLALKDAMQLTVLGDADLSDEELYDRLDHIFDGVWISFTNAGYDRLSNTSLSIPYDETMFKLGNSYETFVGLETIMGDLNDEIGELRARHWRSAGPISCTGAASNDGTTILMDREYMSEVRDLFYPGGECITQAENETLARELLARPDFRNAVRQVIELRQNAAWALGLQRDEIARLKAAIELRMPDVSLPVVSMELMSWPQVTTVETERQTPMRQTGPHAWETTAELADGFIKFRANRDWSLNWGAPFPYMIDAPNFVWNSDRIRLEDVFPSGEAHFNGMNLPVRAGTYRVTFNSRTGEYAFDPVGP